MFARPSSAGAPPSKPRRRTPRAGVVGAGRAASTAARPVRRSGAGARRPHGGSRRPLHLPGPQQAAADRRTVEITGRTVPAPHLPSRDAADRVGAPDAAFPPRGSRRRPSPSPAERLAHRPDRIAAWAAVLGLAMMVVAAL